MNKPVHNLVKSRLAAGKPCYVMGVRLLRTSEVVELAKASGHHGFYIDLQHSTIAVAEAAEICLAGLRAGITPMVRLPNIDSTVCTHMLDAGALGIIVPDLRTADEARQVVSWCRFPPRGGRSPGLHARYGRRILKKARIHIEAETLVIAMLECEAAISSAPEIAAVEGIDALFIGSNDLTASMGIHGEYTHRRVREAYDRAIAAARNSGKRLFVGGIRDPNIVAEFVQSGAARCFFTGIDDGLMLAGARMQIAAFRALES